MIFTDGSKSNAGVGFGVYSSNFKRKNSLPVAASIFTAELHGILAALEKIALLENRNFTILSDSKSVLQSLGIFNSDNPLILKIQQWLHLHKCRGVSINFCWVPAHVGVFGNEEADKLAKQASLELLPMNCPIPFRDFYPYIKISIMNIWQDRWNNIGPNKMKEIASTITPWKYANLPRRWERILCRLRIGHTRLTHSFLMDGGVQPYCEDCLVPLTVRHLLVECPSLGNLRHRFLSWGSERGHFILAAILGENCNTEQLYIFVKEAGLLNKF